MRVLLVTPPFTQINTPYPATLQLAGYLTANGYRVTNYDLSLKVILRIFSRQGLTRLFEEMKTSANKDEFTERACILSEKYINTIEPVLNFLQGKNSNLAYRLVQEGYLPQGESFTYASDEAEAFGSLGLQDKAKYYCSLVIDDLTKIIRKNITPHFGLSRYAEKIAVSPPAFDPVLKELNRQPNLIETMMIDELEEEIARFNPQVIGFTIPFPGNLLAALRSSKYVKDNHPGMKTVIGGGYINTELRKLSDIRIFDSVDYITYDDGELPLLNILKNLERTEKRWVGTLTAEEGKPVFKDDAGIKILRHDELYPPYLSGIKPGEYISMTEMLNPMHRLWSDGYWNKLMVAHGCYWSKCTFCDVNLDYIGRYSPAKASTIVDWMESMITETGRTAFHFTDEAAPPALLKEISLEIIKRDLPVTWWGNIRFEKAFTPDLSRLMAASGCVAVSGGLEVADVRLLKLINKGVTLEQVASVCGNFRQTGIMVHAYLMYGFPSQTGQEIINSLELVRQFVELDLFQSGFWHLFSLTAHSPVAKNPEFYGIDILSSLNNPFANNDLVHNDRTGIDYKKYSSGLRKALYNYMHNVGLDWEVSQWFEFPVPRPTVPKNIIQKYLRSNKYSTGNGMHVVWLGPKPRLEQIENNLVRLEIHTPSLQAEWVVTRSVADWISNISFAASIKIGQKYSFKELKMTFPGGENEFALFAKTDVWKELRETVMLLI